MGRVKTLLQNNTFILIASQIIIFAARLMSTIILTRLLDPSAFGTIAILSTVLLVITLMSDLGFYPYVVRQASALDRDFLDQIWTLRLVRSGIIALIIFGLATPVASLLDAPEIANALRFTALMPLIEGLSSMAFATAVREGQILRLSVMETASTAAQIILSIALCLIMNSFWGVVIGGALGAMLKTGLSYSLFQDSRRQWDYSKERARDLWAFGRFILPSSMMTLLIGQFDKIIFAPLLGPKGFGYYSLASNLASAPNSLIVPYSAKILLPAFAKGHRDHPGHWADTYYAIGQWPRLALLAALGAFMAMPSSIVELLYDERYGDVAFYLQALSICAFLTFTLTVANDALVAIGKVKATLTINFIRLSSLIIFGLLLFFWGGPSPMVAALPLSMVVAQIYASASMAQANLFSIRRELILAAVVTAGFAIGSILNMLVLNILQK